MNCKKHWSNHRRHKQGIVVCDLITEWAWQFIIIYDKLVLIKNLQKQEKFALFKETKLFVIRNDALVSWLQMLMKPTEIIVCILIFLLQALSNNIVIQTEELDSSDSKHKTNLTRFILMFGSFGSKKTTLFHLIVFAMLIMTTVPAFRGKQIKFCDICFNIVLFL